MTVGEDDELSNDNNLDSVDLKQGEDHAKTIPEEKLNPPLGQNIEHLEGKPAQTVSAKATSPDLNPHRPHKSSPSSPIIQTTPPVSSIPPQPPDPPDTIHEAEAKTVRETYQTEAFYLHDIMAFADDVLNLGSKTYEEPVVDVHNGRLEADDAKLEHESLGLTNIVMETDCVQPQKSISELQVSVTDIDREMDADIDDVAVSLENNTYVIEDEDSRLEKESRRGVSYVSLRSVFLTKESKENSSDYVELSLIKSPKVIELSFPQLYSRSSRSVWEPGELSAIMEPEKYHAYDNLMVLPPKLHKMGSQRNTNGVGILDSFSELIHLQGVRKELSYMKSLEHNDVAFHVYGGSASSNVMISFPQWVVGIENENPDIFFSDCEGRSFESIDEERALHGLSKIVLTQRVWEPGGISATNRDIKFLRRDTKLLVGDLERKKDYMLMTNKNLEVLEQISSGSLSLLDSSASIMVDTCVGSKSYGKKQLAADLTMHRGRDLSLVWCAYENKNLVSQHLRIGAVLIETTSEIQSTNQSHGMEGSKREIQDLQCKHRRGILIFKPLTNSVMRVDASKEQWVSHEQGLSSLRSLLVRAYSSLPRARAVGAAGGNKASFPHLRSQSCSEAMLLRLQSLPQVQILEKQKKFHKTWKFKYKPDFLLRVFLQAEQEQSYDCGDVQQLISGHMKFQHEVGKVDKPEYNFMEKVLKGIIFAVIDEYKDIETDLVLLGMGLNGDAYKVSFLVIGYEDVMKLSAASFPSTALKFLYGSLPRPPDFRTIKKRLERLSIHEKDHKVLFPKNHKPLHLKARFWTLFNDVEQLSTEPQNSPGLNYFTHLVFLWNQALNCVCIAGHISSGIFSVDGVREFDTCSKMKIKNEIQGKRLLVLAELFLLDIASEADLVVKKNWFHSIPTIEELFHLQRPPESLAGKTCLSSLRTRYTRVYVHQASKISSLRTRMFSTGE